MVSQSRGEGDLWESLWFEPDMYLILLGIVSRIELCLELLILLGNFLLQPLFSVNLVVVSSILTSLCFIAG